MRNQRLNICLLVLLLMSPLAIWAQGSTVSLTADKEPLPEALNKVERQSGYYKINYDLNLLDKYTVTATIKEKTAPEAVEILISKLPLKSTVKGKYITVSSSKTSEEQTQKDGVSGQILDQYGEPLMGAVVRIKGTDKATITDKDGRFYLAGANPESELEVTYVGKKTIRRKAGTRNMSIIVDDETNTIEDLVVVGYGSTKKKDLTGSVATVDPAELVNMNAVTIDDALAGKVAGMQVTKADGSPGGAVRIRVRGGSSLQSGVDPLYIIDGIPTEITNNYLTSTEVVNPLEANNYGEDFGNSVSGSFMRGLNSLAGLNINDIESISVLKDASATAIYGSKAANGVVIINTKRGRYNQKPQVNVSYSLGISTPIKEKVCNGEQYIQALTESLTNSDANLVANGFEAENAEVLAELLSMENYDTDWLDLILRTAITHNVDASISGGSDKSRYYASISYMNQEGVLISTDFERYTAKFSLDSDFSKRFRAGLNINFSYSKNNLTSGEYAQALSAPPILPAYNEDGSFADYSAMESVASSYMGFQNPLAVASCINQAKTYNFKGSFYGEYTIIDDLKFKSTLSLSYMNYNQLNYIPSYVNISGYYGAEDSEGGKGTQAESTTTNFYWENTLSYNHIFNKIHALNAVIGTSWEKDRMDYFSATGTGYPDDDYLNNLSSATTATSVQGYNPLSQSALLSFYARVNYTLMDRYLFTFTGRADSSSKFSKSNRTGWFPSGAVAWRMSEEKFLKNATWIDDLKIRASIGKTGTQDIDDWMYLTLYTPSSYAGSSALYPSQLGNDDIKWEQTVEWDLGLDFTFFNERLGGTINYYHKTTDGALLSITPAPSTGYTTVVGNVAKVRNTGIEFELYGTPVKTKDWTLDLSFNISHNKSKVLNIYGDMFSDAEDRNALNLGTSVIKEGESLGLLCGYVAVGIIETEEQLEDYKSRFTYWQYLCPDLGIGSIELALDDTGWYYEDVIGNCTPDFYGGFTANLRYKNWNLLAGFTYSYGNDLIYQKDVTDMGFSDLTNRGVSVLNASTAENITGRPANLYQNWYTLTNLNVYDASYLKLQTLSLAYNFPRKWLKALTITSGQIYVTASNLFTITDYPGPDPAVSDDPYSIYGGGRDVSSYPTVRSYSFGVRLGF